MKHTSKVFAVIALAALTAFVGCDMTLEIRITPSPTGKVVNVKTGDPIGNAKVTLRYISGAEAGKEPSETQPYEATSNSLGSFTFNSVEPGQYELTAEDGEYAFTRQIVNVTGGGELPTVGGFVPDSAAALTILTFWDPAYKDIDAHLTFPLTDVTIEAQGATELTETDFYTLAHPDDPTYDLGFFPKDWPNGRFHLGYDADTRVTNKYYAAPATPAGVGGVASGESGSTIYLDLDNWGDDDQNPGGPETITIKDFPMKDSLEAAGVMNGIATPSYTSTGLGDPSRLEQGRYFWAGVMEFYINAYNRDVSDAPNDDPDSLLSTADSADSADTVVYVFQGDSQLGVYTVPTYTTVKTASVLKINLFYGKPVLDNPAGNYYKYYQILPDIRSFGSSDSIRSLGGSNTGIVTAKGPAL